MANSELDELKVAIKEKDDLIAAQRGIIEKQRSGLEIMEGFRLFNDIYRLQTQIMYYYTSKLLNQIVRSPVGSDAEIRRLKALEDIEKSIQKTGEELDKDIIAWDLYLRAFPAVEKVLIGDYQLHLIPLPEGVR